MYGRYTNGIGTEEFTRVGERGDRGLGLPTATCILII